MKRLLSVLVISGLSGLLSLAALSSSVAQAGDTIVLEVAVNRDLGAFNSTGDGFPGSVIYARGNIYPEGTLPSGLSDFDPATESDLGTWRCHFLGLGERDAPLAMITYHFQLEPTGYHSRYHSKESMIIVQGLNAHTFEPPVPRVLAVVGGTGRYAGVTGEVLEEVLGRNTSGSVNSRFTFKLSGIKHGNRGRY